MKPVFIYTLNCPMTGIQRYCGQTVNPDERLRRHIKDARKEKYHNAYWIKSLLLKNLRPVMEILDVVPDTEADFWEREYIQNFRERGFDLTNILDGGEGFEAGEKHPCFGKPGHLLGKPAWNKGIKCPQLSGDKNPFFGKQHPPEIMAKIIAGNTGKKLSPEAIAKREATCKKNGPKPGAFKPGLTPWNKGTKGLQIASPESRQKMSDSQKKRWLKEREKNGIN